MCFDFIFKPSTDSSSDSNSYFEFNSESMNNFDSSEQSESRIESQSEINSESYSQSYSESQTESNSQSYSETQTESNSESNFVPNFSSDFDDDDEIWSESSYNKNDFYESSSSFDYDSESSMSYYHSEYDDIISYNWYEFIISMCVVGGAFACILIALALFGVGYKYKKRRDKNKINKFYTEMDKEETSRNKNYKFDKEDLSVDEIPTIDEKKETITERKKKTSNEELNIEEELKKYNIVSVKKNGEDILPNFVQNDDDNVILPDMIENEIKIHSESTNSYTLSSTSKSLTYSTEISDEN